MKSIKVTYSDEEIIESVKAGGVKLELVMRRFYQSDGVRGKVHSFIRANSGNHQDAEDVFQDALKSLILAIRNGSYKGTGAIDAYLFSTCRNIWYKKFNKNIRQSADADNETEVENENPQSILEYQEKKEIVQRFMMELGPRCKRVLELWNLDYSMKEIADKMNYKSEGMARKKKHTCLQKLIQSVADSNFKAG